MTKQGSWSKELKFGYSTSKFGGTNDFLQNHEIQDGKNGTTKHENGEISCWNQLPGQDAGGERFLARLPRGRPLPLEIERFLARSGGRCAFRGQSEGGDEELSVRFV